MDTESQPTCNMYIMINPQNW